MIHVNATLKKADNLAKSKLQDCCLRMFSGQGEEKLKKMYNTVDQRPPNLLPIKSNQAGDWLTSLSQAENSERKPIYPLPPYCANCTTRCHLDQGEDRKGILLIIDFALKQGLL